MSSALRRSQVVVPNAMAQRQVLREETVVVAQKQGRAYAVMMWLCDVAVR